MLNQLFLRKEVHSLRDRPVHAIHTELVWSLGSRGELISTPSRPHHSVLCLSKIIEDATIKLAVCKASDAEENL